LTEVLKYANISKQGHSQALIKIEKEKQKAILYINLIIQVRVMHPGMGLRTIYENMVLDGIGRDAFIKLGADAGLIVTPQPSGPKTTIAHPSANYPNLLGQRKFTDVNQVWSSDITYFRIKDYWCYLIFIMDVYSRRIVGHAVAKDMRAINNVAALQMAFDLRGINNYEDGLIHHSDRGGQYISDIYTKCLSSHGARISMCTNVLENAHIERVNGTIKNQYLKHWSINDLKQLEKATNEAVHTYNHHKPHSSLGRKTPVEFEKFIKGIPLSDRSPLEIFTYTQNSDKVNPSQLSFEF